MKKYIIIGWCGGMGGGQVYTRNKCVIAQKAGYTPIVIHCSLKATVIPDLKKYENKVREVRFPPSYYSSKEQKAILNRIIAIINPQSDDEFFVESNDSCYAYWAELLAKTLNCKHFAFLLEYFFSHKDENIDYFRFKAKRHELAGIMKESLPELFGNHYVLLDDENKCLSAFSTNSVEDIPIPFEFDTTKYNIVLGNIGRITKPYIQSVCKDLGDFASEHLDKKILLLLVGGEPGTIEEKRIKEHLCLCNNVDVFSTGFLFPIPEKLLANINVATATSGCIIIALKANLITVGYRDNDNYPSGVCGYDLKMFPPPDVPVEKRKKLGEYLEDILFGDFCQRFQYTPYLDDGDHKERWHQMEVDTEYMMAPVETGYYDTTHIYPKSVLKRLYIRLFGQIIPFHKILELVERSGIMIKYHSLIINKKG